MLKDEFKPSLCIPLPSLLKVIPTLYCVYRTKYCKADVYLLKLALDLIYKLYYKVKISKLQKYLLSIRLKH